MTYICGGKADKVTQQIIITAETAVALRPLVESAIQNELKSLKFGIQRTQERLRLFEEAYHLSTQAFEEKFQHGALAESLDFIEWFGEIKTLHLLRSQEDALRKAQLQ